MRPGNLAASSAALAGAEQPNRSKTLAQDEPPDSLKPGTCRGHQSTEPQCSAWLARYTTCIRARQNIVAQYCACLAIVGLWGIAAGCSSPDASPLIGAGGSGPTRDSGFGFVDDCARAGGVCQCGGCQPGSSPAGPGYLLCPSVLGNDCGFSCCVRDTSQAAGDAAASGPIFRGVHAVDGAAPRDAEKAEIGDPFPGGPCDHDACVKGQICLSLTVVSGQFNPGGAGAPQPSTQTTKTCRTVPSACDPRGSCDRACCDALCGGGTDAICTCSLSSTSAGCMLGLP